MAYLVDYFKNLKGYSTLKNTNKISLKSVLQDYHKLKKIFQRKLAVSNDLCKHYNMYSLYLYTSIMCPNFIQIGCAIFEKKF